VDFGVPALLDLLPPAELALLQAFAIRRTYRNGEVIHEHGDAALSVGIVISGQVRLINIAPGGQELLVGSINPGQNYGDIVMFGHGIRTHRAMSAGDTVVEHIPADSFHQLLIHPSIVRAFYTVATHRLNQAISMLDDIRTRPPEVRLAKLLLSMRSTKPGSRIDCL
jgi:CRP-like cAMP-binding protein